MKVIDRNKIFFDAQTLLYKREVLGVYVFQYVHYARPHLWTDYVSDPVRRYLRRLGSNYASLRWRNFRFCDVT